MGVSDSSRFLTTGNPPAFINNPIYPERSTKSKSAIAICVFRAP
jgi:hypothetical protein